MPIDISGLQEYVKLHPEIVSLTVRKNSIVQILSDIRTYLNELPGKHLYRIFDAKSNLQNCCDQPTGGSVVTEREVNVICLLDGDEYCETDLAQIIYDADMRFTAGDESAGSIEQVITEGQLDAFIVAIDTLIFQGDLASSDPNLNKVDGLIKIAETSGITQTATTGTLYSAIKRAIAAIPANARRGSNRIGVFVGEEWGDVLQTNYLGLNLYHYNPGSYEAYSQLPIFGFSGVVLIPTPGLTGTGKMLVTPISNIVYFTNRANDIETLDWDYSKYHQRYYWRIKTIFGIDLKVPEWAVSVTLGDDLLTGAVDYNVNIVNNPLNVATITTP